MTKLIFVAAALSPVALLGQWPAPSHFVQPAYVTGSKSRSMGMEVNIPRGQGGPIQGKPLSAVEVYRTTQVLADGTHVDHTNTSRFYRDDLGRMRSESPTRILIFDPVAGFTYHMDGEHKTYTRSALDGAIGSAWISAEGGRTSVSTSSEALAPGDPGAVYAQRRSSQSARRPVTEELPPQVVNGLWTKGSRITITIPAGTFGNDRDIKVVNERWYSEDLKVLVKSTNSDPRYGVTTYELTQVVQAPPNPELLKVPADYRMVPPGTSYPH